MATRLTPRHTTQAGFTLIETLVTASLVVVLLIAVVGMLLSTISTSSRRESFVSARNEGNYALAQMELLVRNAVQIVPDPRDPAAPTCAAGMSKISLRSLDEGVTTLFNNAGRIASLSARESIPFELTGGSNVLSGPTFSCTQPGPNESAYITISFTLTNTNAEFGPQTARTETFQTAAQIRSY